MLETKRMEECTAMDVETLAANQNTAMNAGTQTANKNTAMDAETHAANTRKSIEAPALRGLTPRDYQLALFQQALRSNSIVMLETGTGKTLVAVMLIEWFAQRAAAASAGRRKVRVFLNNTVALVHQQARVIGSNTAQAVHEYVGAMGLDEWDDATWTRTWAQADVLVMTHQVLLNALRSGRARIGDIDLLVFDEAHHARGNHPYMLIMREFYDHCVPEDRPHIFGMTASPLNARQTAETSVRHLQASLDADVCTVDLTAAVDKSPLPADQSPSPAAARPSAMCYEYALPPAFAPTQLTAALAAACADAKVVARGLRAAPVILALLGPFGVDQMWLYYLRQWHRAAVLRPAPSRGVQGAQPDAAADDPLVDIAYLKHALELARTHGGALLDATSDRDLEHMLPATARMHPVPQLRMLGLQRRPWAQVRAHLSPQVNRLLGILLQWRDRPNALRGIVFAGRRITAVLLTYIVTLIAEFEFVRADVLLGAAQKQTGSIDRPIRGGAVRTANQLTLADFADGRLNLVFATQVAEEGVDIQPCNLVIRFDMPKTATSLIQSRGRARMADSQFIVMVPHVAPELRRTLEVPASAAPLVADDALSAMDADGPETTPETPESQSLSETQPLPEHQGSYTDYLRLVHLEDCLRDWCRAESLANSTSDASASNVIVSSGRAHQEYGRMLYNLRIDDSPSTELEELWVEQGDKKGRIYTIVATQARITYMSAVPIIHSYVQHLPQDQLCKLVPIFDFEQVQQQAEPAPPPQTGAAKKSKVPAPTVLFRCTITLPSNAAVRRVAGPLMPNKRLAKQAASYRAAKKLHQLGAIDDSLSPVTDPDDDKDSAAAGDAARPDTNGANAKQASRKAKGARSSTDMYEIAVPRAFSRPEPTADSQVAASDEAPKYSPCIWHLYLVSLKHPSAATPSRIVFLTAQRLPPDISVPLFVNQYDTSTELRDTGPTLLRPEYLGSQVLGQTQVDTLAQFSSKLFARIMHMMLTWKESEIGSLLAPLNDEGTGIDFRFARSCFEDRSIVYRDKETDYSAMVGTLIMDGLDQGHVKIVEKICGSVDIYSDLCAYHAEHEGSNTPVQRQNMDTADPGEQPAKKRKGAKTKHTVRTMAKWADVKRLNRLRPPREIAANVPLFRVRTLNPAFNYLSVTTHGAADSAHEEPQDTNAAKVAAGTAFPEGHYTSPFFCAREPLAPGSMANMSLLPAFFTRLNQLLLSHDVKGQLALRVQVQTVREALTSSSASTDVCYERLETLGDSVLKFVATVMLFVAFPDAHEGILTSRRGRIVCNANLFSLSARLGLPPYIISQMFVKRDVRLPGRGWDRMPFIPAKWICISPFFKAPQAAGNSIEGADVKTSDGSDAKPCNGSDTKTSDGTNGKPSDGSNGKASNGSNGKPSNGLKQRQPAEAIVVGTTRLLSEKTVADIIESLLGASVLDGGIDGALAAARALGVVDSGWTSWESFASVWRSNIAARKRKMGQISSMRTEMLSVSHGSQEADDLLQEMTLDQSDILFGVDLAAPNPQQLCPAGPSALQYQLDQTDTSATAAAQIEATLGYTFNDRTLLTEALTHCSSLDVTSSSYQRLEFLGDAVLDYFLTKRYYDHRPALSPHRITLVKHIAASNDLFAIVLVCNGLQKYVRHGSAVIRDAIRDYERRLGHARQVWGEHQSHSDAAADAGGGSNSEGAPAGRPAKSRRVGNSLQKAAADIYADLPPEAWDAVRAPKVLGDILESLIGAVFVDSGMSHEAASSVYERVLSPFLDRFVDSGKLSLHPVIQTLLVCQGWGCDALSWESGTDANPLEYARRYVCHVAAHGQRISTGAGESPRHAKYNAASRLLAAIGAVAPNALDGDLSAVHTLAADKAAGDGSGETVLDKLLKPICTCAARRKAEAEQRAAAEEEKRRLEEEKENNSGGSVMDGGIGESRSAAMEPGSAAGANMDEDTEEGEIPQTA